MKIRLLKKNEVKEAAMIVGKNYSKEYKRLATLELKEMFHKAYSTPTYFVAEDKGKIVGFAGYIQSWMDYSVYELFWVNVLPRLQRQGIGKQLVYKIIQEIKRKKGAYLILLTADAAVKNPEYYEKNFGFKTSLLFSPKTYHLMTLSTLK